MVYNPKTTAFEHLRLKCALFLTNYIYSQPESLYLLTKSKKVPKSDRNKKQLRFMVCRT